MVKLDYSMISSSKSKDAFTPTDLLVKERRESRDVYSKLIQRLGALIWIDFFSKLLRLINSDSLRS